MLYKFFQNYIQIKTIIFERRAGCLCIREARSNMCKTVKDNL